MEPSPKDLFEAFKSAYASKYQFYWDIPIGGGAYGQVYKAIDFYRSVDVAIKIFLQGQPPRGVERAWNITSRIIGRQIAPTFTIEEFQYLKKDYVAVVSRFVPGRTIK